MRGAPRWIATGQDFENCIGSSDPGISAMGRRIANAVYGNSAFALSGYLQANYKSQFKNIVCEGDSVTFGYNVQMSYPAWLAYMLRDAGLQKVTNVGISGSYMSTYNPPAILDRAVANVDALYDSDYQKNIAVLLTVNDLRHGPEHSIDEDDVYGYIETWCLARKATGFEVVVLSLPAEYEVVGYEPHRDALNIALRAGYTDFADALADVALDPVIGINIGDPDSVAYDARYYLDGVHLSSSGYYIMAEYVKNAILSL